jgi:glycerol-3-phosphate O-acyltransferase
MAVKLKDLDAEARKLSDGFRDEIAHQYDQKMTDRLSGFVDGFVRYFFIANYYIDGIDNMTSIPDDVPVILSSIHKSHLDYVLIGLAMYQHEVELPVTIAGKNLFHGLFEKLLPRLKGVCLDRDRVDTKSLRNRENLLYLSTFYSYLMEEVVNQGDAITIFPEGGRSYDGSILPLSLGIFGIAKRALQEHGSVAIVPIGITYDRITEDARFSGFEKCKQRSNRAYRAHDKRGFYHHALLQPKSNAYVDFGTPMLLDDVRHMDELEKELRRRMGALIRVTPVSLVCRALENKRKVPMDEVLQHLRDDLHYVRENDLLIGKGIRYRTASRVFKRSLEHLCNRMRFRNVFRIEQRLGKKIIRVRRSDVVAYYANTISHLFPDAHITPLEQQTFWAE